MPIILTGCTQVRIYGGDGVVVKNELGIVHVSIKPASNPSFVEAKTLGVIIAENSFTAGWSRRSMAVFPDPKRCAVLIVSTSVQDVVAIDSALKLSGNNLSNICITGEQ